ncbi:MAG: hypothetical protein HUK08_02715 [Bacteroidaceae bacterium]|nr:hypothetical protein [Bacteroidaceae bacterium]
MFYFVSKNNKVENLETMPTEDLAKTAFGGDKETFDLFLDVMSDFAVASSNNVNDVFLDENQKPLKSREMVKSKLKLIESEDSALKARLQVIEDKLAKKNDKYATKVKDIVARIKNQIEDKDAMIAKLFTQIDEKMNQIAMLQQNVSTLNQSVTNLNKDVKQLEEKKAEQQETIEKQTEQLNEAFYIVASKKFLKEAGILTGGGLFSRRELNASMINKDSLTKIDIQVCTNIPLTVSNPKVLTQHPQDSYTLRSDTLFILDTQRFWSLSRILIIQE